MVAAVSPVRLLEKLPVSVPSVVFELLVVGPVVVDQHIPLTVTVPPPFDVILPPETADVKVIPVTALVVIVATTTGLVVKVRSVP